MKYASRKFLIAMTSLCCAQWSLWEKLIDADAWRTVVVGVMGLYGLVNVGQKVVEAKKEAQ